MREKARDATMRAPEHGGRALSKLLVSPNKLQWIDNNIALNCIMVVLLIDYIKSIVILVSVSLFLHSFCYFLFFLLLNILSYKKYKFIL